MSSQNKKCFVLFCMNTTRNCPEKNFLSVPQDKEKKQWCEYEGAVLPKTKTVLFCCKDHFEVTSVYWNLIINFRNKMILRIFGKLYL